MASNSRIRFNPVTKEIEVEGTEQFVKTYFDKLQAMISGAAGKKTKGKAAPTKATKPAEKKVKGKRVTNISAVLSLIQNSPEGISTAELKKKTKLSERQIWSIVDRAAKMGKIRKLKRGSYGAVAAG
jgi:uncharacterized membrane protein